MRRLAVLLPFLLLVACSIQQQPIRTLQIALPAAGVSALTIAVNVGAITITPSNDTNVHVSVALTPSNSFFGLITDSNSENAAHAATLEHALDNGNLKLSMQYPASASDSGVKENWTVAVPASMHINTHVSVGKLEVSGITGGVDADLDVGKVQLDVPSGPLKISANVGKIQATVHSLAYGDVTVGANVGDASLTVDGVSLGNLQKAGAGNSVNYQGKGKDAISLQVNTGKASLALLTHQS